MHTRKEIWESQFIGEPAYRFQQIQKALVNPEFSSWDDLSMLPKGIREKLSQALPFRSIQVLQILDSKVSPTYKAIVKLQDGLQIETVLMGNAREQWTICVSSQVGCAMACTFCATGKMGLSRSLTEDEIFDQYRVWQHFLKEHPELPQRISNVVFMGMGEPMANYEAVKTCINNWLKYTDLGPTHITVSTVGLLPALENLLKDPDWPHVRLAISLHSADPGTRSEIVPTTFAGFLEKLEDWGKRYLKKFGNRRHHLTFEYVMLQEVNDTPEHARLLAQFSNRLGQVRVNLIPYNFTDLGFQRSIRERTEKFKELLEKEGVTATIRRTMGDDIAAACGQLIKIKSKDS